MKHNYLITGGAGFIGSHFVHYLSQNKIDMSKIIVLDKLTYAGDFRRIESLIGGNVNFVEGDICDEKQVKMLLSNHGISCIINFAAESHVDRSIEKQEDFLKTNIEGVQNLMNCSKNYWESIKFQKNKDSLKKPVFLQVSTDEVYGGVPLNTINLRDEKTVLNPTNPYAATKAAADLLIGAYKNTYNYPAIIVRPTNNYGLNQHGEKFIPKVIDALIKDKPIPIYGTGQQKRTWLHVEDTCLAILNIIERGDEGDIYNIAGRETFENKRLVDKLIGVYNEYSPKLYCGEIIFVEDRLGHDPYYAIDGSKLETKLDFEPTITLEEGLKNLVKEYLNKKDFKGL